MKRQPELFNERRRYKKLALDFPFTLADDEWRDCVKESERFDPIFKSDVYYFDRRLRQCWLEIGSDAFPYGNIEAFEYELNTVGVPLLSDETRAAIKQLIRDRLASDRQRELLRYDDDLRMIRAVYAESKIRASKMLHEMRRYRHLKKVRNDESKVQ